MNKTDILIIHLNGEEVIRNCLRSIYKNTKNFTVSLLLNNSTDGSKEIIEKEFPEVNLSFSNQTIGFAEACNALARKSKANNIVLLNNDVEVSPGWLDELIKTKKKHKNCVAVQSKIHSYHKRDYFEYAGAAGGFIDKYGYPFCRGRLFNTIEKDTGQYNDEIRLFWGCGVCLLVDRKFFINSGGFDEDFFMYAEEIDFCWRSNLLGKEIWYSPKSLIYHIGSFSAKKGKINVMKEYFLSRNHLLMLLKNYSAISLIKIMPIRISLEIISAIRFFPGKTIGSLYSLFTIPFIFISKTYQKRRIIQSKRRVNDKDLKKLMFQGSLAWEYFIKGNKTFKDIRI